MIIHYDKYHPNMCIDPIISFMDRFMGEAKYAFKNQHHHEQVNEGTDWCGFKQMVLIRSDHTHRAAQMVSRANVWQTGFQLVQTVKSAI